MQHRYTGDIGDYLKFSLLRAIPVRRCISVCWWLHPDESHNGDGRHTDYLTKPELWRAIDEPLFEALGQIVKSERRRVEELEAVALKGTASFYSKPVPTGRTRVEARAPWFESLQEAVAGSDVIFLDPDNGIDLHPNAARRCSAKHVTLEEIAALGTTERTLVVYHHQTRAKGGHLNEIARIQTALGRLGLGEVTAVRARPYSPRVFFVISREKDVHSAVAEFSDRFLQVYEVYRGQQLSSARSDRSDVWQAQIVTLYPEMFPGPLGISLAGRALTEGKWSCAATNIRDFATDKHKSVDDTPAGGGAGMVMRADVLAAAVDHAILAQPTAPILAMTPRGKPLTQARIRALASGPGVTIICGRFEGIDERLFDARPQIEQVSIGDFILSGGEVGALVLLDACIRLLPGVMGAPLSGDDESFEAGLLEYPHYTRPAEWEGRTIPQVLRSGDHAKIAAWRQRQAEDDTRLRRPDLWEWHIAARVQPASDARRKNKEHMGHEPHPDD